MYHFLGLLYNFLHLILMWSGVSVILTEGGVRGDQDDLINYQCPTDQVIIVHSKTADYIKMHCGKPSICGQSRSCSVQSIKGGVCRGKGNYLQNVGKNNDKSLLSSCCKYSPAVELHVTDRCTAQDIFDKPVPPEKVTTRLLSPSLAASSTASPTTPPSSPAQPSTPAVDIEASTISKAALTTGVRSPLFIVNDLGQNRMGESRVPLGSGSDKLLSGLGDYPLPNLQPVRVLNPKGIIFSPGSPDPQIFRRKRSDELIQPAVLIEDDSDPNVDFVANSKNYVSSSQYGNVDLKLFKLTELQRPVELVKGIERIPDGYRVTSCIVCCMELSNNTKVNSSTPFNDTVLVFPPTVTLPSSSSAPSTNSTSSNLASLTTSTKSSLSQTSGCRLISFEAAKNLRELIKAGRLRQEGIPGYKELGKYCNGAHNQGCLERCVKILETRFKDAHCQPQTSNCICNQDLNPSNFEANLKLAGFDPFNPVCYLPLTRNVTDANDPAHATPSTKPPVFAVSSTNAGKHTTRNNSVNQSDTISHPDIERFLKDGACFDAEGLVRVRDGSMKRMDQLRVWDEILTVTDRGETAFEPLEWFYHRNPNQPADFIQISTKSGNKLTLTKNHLLPIIDCIDGAMIAFSINKFTNERSRFAEKAKVGQCLLSVAEGGSLAVDQITNIETLQKVGIFSPITKSGSIVVNGVHVSCYSSVENHVLQKSLHNFFISAHKSVMRLFGFFANFRSTFGQSAPMGVAYDSDIPSSLRFMLEVAKVVLPPNIVV